MKLYKVNQSFFEHIDEYESNESFKEGGIKQVMSANNGTCKYPRQSTDNHCPGEGPNHSAFPDISEHSARNGCYVKKMICCADRWSGESQIADLKREQEKGPGNPAH